MTAELNLLKTGATIGSPPAATITTPDQVSCGGQLQALTADITDPDSDVVSTRWIVDGVLMSPATTAVEFSGPHALEVRIEDARGAVTTERKDVTCV